MQLATIDDIQSLLQQQGYISDRSISTALFLSARLKKPLLVEGPAGVGKTEIAKVLSAALQAPLIRLQCYEGIDAGMALYEWNYQRQLLRIRLEEESGKSVEEKEAGIFGPDFLLDRPLLKAIRSEQPAVLLIDELDRSDEAFESFLLELLSDWQITIPELGTLKAIHIPFVVITSNRTRELSDALRRRCLYLWIDYPSFEKELSIVLAKVPKIDQRLASEICSFLQIVRSKKLQKLPGVAETLDWAAALAELHGSHLDAAIVEETAGVLFKSQDDLQKIKQRLLPEILDSMRAMDKA